MGGVNFRFSNRSGRNGCEIAEILETDADCAAVWVLFRGDWSGRFSSAAEKPASPSAGHQLTFDFLRPVPTAAPETV
jgi:hypothetical protein